LVWFSLHKGINEQKNSAYLQNVLTEFVAQVKHIGEMQGPQTRVAPRANPNENL